MVLFLRSKKGFRYIPENESEQDILGWNKSLILNLYLVSNLDLDLDIDLYIDLDLDLELHLN